MVVHNVQIQKDLINTLGNAITPLSMDEVVHEVTNRGFKKQKIYEDSEIVDVLKYLVKLGFVKESEEKYEWIK